MRNHLHRRGGSDSAGYKLARNCFQTDPTVEDFVRAILEIKPEDLESPNHRCLEFRNPETGKPFAWEFHRRRKRIVRN